MVCPASTTLPVLCRPLRKVRCAFALLLAAGLAQSAAADEYSWNTGDGWWFDPGNWAPNGVPTWNDTIRIGNLPGVHGSTVIMGGELTQGFDLLEVSEGMLLDTNGTELVSFGTARIMGNGAGIIARPQAMGPNQHDFQADLRIEPGAFFQLQDNVPVRLFGSSQSGGVISGRGSILVASAVPFANRGVIRPSNNGGLTLTQGSNPGSLLPIDLDGNTTGNGHLDLSTQFSVLTVNAGSLTDSFSGTVSMVPGALLNMNIDEGWSADAGSVINVAGFGNPAAASQIAGTDFTFGGTMNVGAAEGHLRVLAPTTLQESATVNIGNTDWVEFDGATTVLGGQYTLGDGARLDFDGETTMQGGTFATAGATLVDGGVFFNGPTEWRGNITINGAAQQNGDAGVSGGLGATISAGTFDMDGASGDTHWNIDSNLVVRAGAISADGANVFEGSMDIGGGFLGRLTMNVGNDPWSNYGQMNLTGDTNLFLTRLAGSAMQMFGDLAVTSGRVQVTADLLIASSSTVNIGPASAALRTTGNTRVESGAAFSGIGTLRNGSTGRMTFTDGVDLNGVGFVNQGRFEIGAGDGVLGIGAASVAGFENTSTGIWSVSLGGYLPGDEHDLLTISGGAAVLDGLIQVEHLDLGSGVFLPQIGDEFTVLTAVGGVSGAFTDDPISLANGLTFEWSVLYEPNNVVLRLDNIVPSPGTLALFGLGGLIGARRRGRWFVAGTSSLRSQA